MEQESKDTFQLRVFNRYCDSIGIKTSNIKDSLILDVAAGDGSFSKVAEHYGCQILSLDINRPKATESPKGFILGSSLNLPFAEESFQSTFSVGYLANERREDLLQIITEFLRVTKTSGEVRLQFPIWITNTPIIKEERLIPKIEEQYKILTLALSSLSIRENYQGYKLPADINLWPPYRSNLSPFFKSIIEDQEHRLHKLKEIDIYKTNERLNRYAFNLIREIFPNLNMQLINNGKSQYDIGIENQHLIDNYYLLIKKEG